MNPFDQALFPLLNLGGDAPAQLVHLARWVSDTMPAWLVGAVLASALAGGWRGTAQPSSQGSSPHWQADVRWLHQAARVALAMALAALVAHFLRNALALPRPAQLHLGMQWVAHAAGPGFPSLHAASMAALAASLRAPTSVVLRALAVGAALAMAWSRVALGVHFPSDVLAGLITGCLAAWAAGGLQAQWLRHRQAHARLGATQA